MEWTEIAKPLPPQNQGYGESNRCRACARAQTEEQVVLTTAAPEPKFHPEGNRATREEGSTAVVYKREGWHSQVGVARTGL